MKLFRRTKTNSNPSQEELAGSIAGKLIYWQTRAADYLNGKTKHLSAKTRLMLLLIFCVLFAAINVYLLIRSI